ncbi:hypothetical protein ILUMI_09353 [Ignelater luminosus]|uniref:THAP-type domain-containing protein n=1 Tax=Ignelater luminosus TaxID=2038154 RepID=A0A8K0D579_IGNLU|nr:hypothetical protein ILUMI_09353 [Ignelater luminosus]
MTRKSKSKVYCSVPQCHNYISKTYSMHRFPRDKDLMTKWQLALQIGKPISKYMFVCSEHFLPTDYIKSSVPNPQKRQLKKGVIPSQKIPCVSHEKVSTLSSTRKKLLAEEVHVEQMYIDQTHVKEEANDAVVQISTSGTVLKERP